MVATEGRVAWKNGEGGGECGVDPHLQPPLTPHTPHHPTYPPLSTKLEIHTSFLWQEVDSSVWQGGGDGRGGQAVFRGQLAALYDALLTYWRRAA